MARHRNQPGKGSYWTLVPEYEQTFSDVTSHYPSKRPLVSDDDDTPVKMVRMTDLPLRGHLLSNDVDIVVKQELEDNSRTEHCGGYYSDEESNNTVKTSDVYNADMNVEERVRCSDDELFSPYDSEDSMDSGFHDVLFSRLTEDGQDLLSAAVNSCLVNDQPLDMTSSESWSSDVTKPNSSVERESHNYSTFSLDSELNQSSAELWSDMGHVAETYLSEFDSLFDFGF